MIWLVLGVLLWAYSHLMKRLTPGFRAGLGNGLGKGVATVLTVLALIAMIYGYRHADYVQVWQPPTFLRHVNNLLMLIAVVLLNIGYSRGVMRTWLRHPMLTAVLFWSVAHLLVNGDLASLELFGGIGIWAMIDMLAINRMEPAWVRPAAGPFRNDVIYIAASLVLFVLIVAIHTWLGYPPFG
ncbi:MAG: NnrU family protein [bacterium]